MQESLFKTATATEECGKTHRYSYWLITTQIPAGQISFEEYGVRITAADGESACLPSLTHSYSRIGSLLALLAEHTVSPSHLYDVAADWAKENHLPQPMLQQVADMV